MFPDLLTGKPVWRFFRDICAIPHTSGNEEAISSYVMNFAKQRILESSRDDMGNVLIRKPGKGSTVVLQAHLDMVGEKATGSGHDFLLDPVPAVVEGDWLMARETTLGADNGIGVAIMLELLDNGDVSLPPLECLFTVDEERGLVGAAKLPPEWITGKRMINLDSEELGTICIGCAGGRDITIELGSDFEPWDGPAVEIKVGGLAGGHSGMEIGAGRANALKLCARICRQLEELLEGRLVSIQGGSKHNAIPRNAEAVMAVEDPSRAETLCSFIKDELVLEYSGIEASLQISCTPVQTRRMLTAESAGRVIDMLLILPHGVTKMSGVVEGLVETSTNLAVATWKTDGLSLLSSVRSALESGRDAQVESIAAAGRLSGDGVTAGEGYPGWAPDPSSPLLKTAREVMVSFLGLEARVEAIHAGLECGIISRIAGGLDMISLGPDIRNVHVPGESVSIPSVERFYRFILCLLERLVEE